MKHVKLNIRAGTITLRGKKQRLYMQCCEIHKDLSEIKLKLVARNTQKVMLTAANWSRFGRMSM